MQIEVDQMRERMRELRLETENISRRRDQEIGAIKENEAGIKE